MIKKNKIDRKNINWLDDSYYDEKNLNQELERVFDICHGCRRCFNLCSSFPTLFDLIDNSDTGEVDGLLVKDYKKVADDCTLCDICFINKCPYVPPHELDVDFPHLMLRYKAIEFKKNGLNISDKLLSNPDLLSPVASSFSSITNALSDVNNKTIRKAIEKVTDIDCNAQLPIYSKKTLINHAKSIDLTTNSNLDEEVFIFTTCYCNYNSSNIGISALNILKKIGIKINIDYPNCCGMPLLEKGDLKSVAKKAKLFAKFYQKQIEENKTIVSLTPSCSLMLKTEWPLLLPDNELIINLSNNAQDISEYLMNLHKKYNLVQFLQPIEDLKELTIHLACHSRAQNIGKKAYDLLSLIPELKVSFIEKCSGHGGVWGFMKNNFNKSLDYSKASADKIIKNSSKYIVSECPLAMNHLAQGLSEFHMQELEKKHPLEIFELALK